MVLVKKILKEPVGFISAKNDKAMNKFFEKKIVTIPLNAVDKAKRRRGIYKGLVYKLVSILKAQGVDFVAITSQLTIKPIARTWLGLGAKARCPKLVFHKFMG